MHLDLKNQLRRDQLDSLLQVGNYRSALTVRPHTAPELPGTEFCLTGFEDPGVQLPETIITWVLIATVVAISQFLCFILFPIVLSSGSSQRDARVHAGTESSLPEAAKGEGEQPEVYLPHCCISNAPKRSLLKTALLFHRFPSAGAVRRTTLDKSARSDNNNNSMLHMLDLTHNGFLWMTGLASFHHVEWAVCKNISHVKKCAQCYPLQ